MSATHPSSGSERSGFDMTRWSIVLAAGGEAGDAGGRREALGELVRTYWPPLYAYLRRDGQPCDRAEDLVQAFFARLIEKNDLRSVDRDKGRFRSFLLASLKHFVLNERDKERALKRGGGVRPLSLHAGEAESRYGVEVVDLRTPEDAFNRQWALTLLDAVLDRLRREYVDRGQANVYEAIRPTLTGDGTEPYADIAARLGTTEGAARVAAHRMRRRYRELLRAEIEQTVSDPSLVDEEMRDLFDCLSRP
jgi:RNA polymerase sigma-70 factor (ECF subfamily)